MNAGSWNGTRAVFNSQGTRVGGAQRAEGCVRYDALSAAL